MQCSHSVCSIILWLLCNIVRPKYVVATHILITIKPLAQEDAPLQIKTKLNSFMSVSLIGRYSRWVESLLNSLRHSSGSAAAVALEGNHNIVDIYL